MSRIEMKVKAFLFDLNKERLMLEKHKKENTWIKQFGGLSLMERINKNKFEIDLLENILNEQPR
jgi:hypothetical protein